MSNYDQRYFPANRINFLKKWINLPNTKAIAFVRDKIIEGYGVLRPTADAYKIGPLYADSY